MSGARVFPEAQLRWPDRTRGRTVHIARGGSPYDVRDAPLWRMGEHQDVHCAGIDLTRSLRRAALRPPCGKPFT